MGTSVGVWAQTVKLWGWLPPGNLPEALISLVKGLGGLVKEPFRVHTHLIVSSARSYYIDGGL